MPRFRTEHMETKKRLENRKKYRTLPAEQRSATAYTVKYLIGDSPLPKNLRVDAANQQAAEAWVKTQMPGCTIVNPQTPKQ